MVRGTGRPTSDNARFAFARLLLARITNKKDPTVALHGGVFFFLPAQGRIRTALRPRGYPDD